MALMMIFYILFGVFLLSFVVQQVRAVWHWNFRKNLHWYLLKLSGDKNKTFPYYRFPIFGNPADIKKIHSARITGVIREERLNNVLDFMGCKHGLFTVEGPEWSHTRRITQPFFSSVGFDADLTIIAGKCSAMLDKLGDSHSGSGPTMCRRLTESIIFQKLLNIDLEENPAALNIFLEWMRIMAEEFARKASTEKVMKAKSDVINMVRAKMTHLRKLFHESATEDEIIGNAFTMLLTGHDTTSSALAAELFTLLQHPSYIKKIESEVDVIEDPKKLVTCPLLENIFMETLRLYPIAPLNILKVNSGEVYPNINAGQIVITSYIGAHYSKKHWDNPTKFYPERWTDNNCSDNFFGFGASPRLCPGRHFAKHTTCIFLGMLFKSFSLSSDSNFNYKQVKHINQAAYAFTDYPICFTRKN